MCCFEGPITCGKSYTQLYHVQLDSKQASECIDLETKGGRIAVIP